MEQQPKVTVTMEFMTQKLGELFLRAEILQRDLLLAQDLQQKTSQVAGTALAALEAHDADRAREITEGRS